MQTKNSKIRDQNQIPIQHHLFLPHHQQSKMGMMCALVFFLYYLLPCSYHELVDFTPKK
jgi:hypothetical protein